MRQKLIYEWQDNGTTAETAVEINCTIGAAMIYSAQFGGDMYEAFRRIAIACENADDNPDRLLSRAIAQGKVSEAEITALVGDDNAISDEAVKTLTEKLSAMLEEHTELTADEIITARNILWALAKAADKSIPDVDDWADSFEVLPVKDLILRAYPIWIKSQTGTVKN